MTRSLHSRSRVGRVAAVLLTGPLALSPILTTPAAAQWIVYDPTNYVQNVLSAARALEQINNQITSLQNEATMLINQARNLASLPYSSLQQLQQSVQRTQQLLGQAQRIAYDVQNIDQAFQTTYGNASMSASDQQLVAQARERWQNTVGGLQDAMRVQAGVVGNIDTNRAEMSSLIGRSQGATRGRAAGLGEAHAPLAAHDPRRPGHCPRRPLRRRPWRWLLRQSLRRGPLMFKRPSTHYGKAAEPDTPYQRAAQVWDERIGASRVQAKNWRLMAFGSLILSAGFAAALVWQSARGTIVPWVVQVDRLGQAQAVAPAVADYRPTDPQIAFHLARFIEQVRSIPADAIIVRQNWLRAYDFTTDRGAAALNDYARANDPFTKVGRQQIAVEVSSVIRASPDSFRVAWIERRYENGQLATTERWTAILTIVVQVPRNADRLRANPLGIYVNAINWSRELGQ